MSDKFPLGRLLVTRGVSEEMIREPTFAVFVNLSLRKHRIGEWGDLSESDKNSNDLALKLRTRILSAYKNCEFKKIWIITEADRSATTVLFPEEY